MEMKRKPKQKTTEEAKEVALRENNSHCSNSRIRTIISFSLLQWLFIQRQSDYVTAVQRTAWIYKAHKYITFKYICWMFYYSNTQSSAYTPPLAEHKMYIFGMSGKEAV